MSASSQTPRQSPVILTDAIAGDEETQRGQDLVRTESNAGRERHG